MAYIDEFGCKYSDDKKKFVRCPENYKGHYTIQEGVTSIGYRAFSGCRGLTSITIPNSVTSIGGSAFSGCSGLTSVTIPNSVTSIGEGAFRGCSGLTSVTISNSVTSIEEGAFDDCSGLTSVTIPNSVTSIGVGAFYGTAWLANQPDGVIYINQLLYTYKGEMPANTSIVVRDGTTQICVSAFSGCSGLTSVTIPNSVTSIGKDALRGCSGLTSIIVESGNTTYDSRNNCNAIIETATNTLVLGCQSTIIPNSVTSIGGSAFRGCSGLTSITIPNSVTSIGEGAFSSVPNIVYSGTATGSPWGARSLNGYVERYLVYESEAKTQLLACSSAATGEITIPNSVTSIGGSAFSSCSGLTSVTIPNSVTSIGDWAFEDCSGLTSVTIPNSVTSIGYDAFLGCSGLTSVTIGNSVTSIGDNAFKYCSGLTAVVWNAKNCADFAKYYDGYDEKYYYGPFCNIASQITSFTFGSEVEHIPAYLCYGMENLASLTIPNSVTSIGGAAFYDCSGLTSVTIGNSVTSIGNFAFRNCSGLTSVMIPNSVTSIGGAAFYDCSKLTSVTIGNSVTSIGRYAFQDCSELKSVTIPSSVTSIGEYAFYNCSSLTSVVWNAKKCADFAIYYEYENKYYGPFCNIASQITSFTFGSEVEHIPAYLCSGMKNLTSVTIGNSVTSIGYGAFRNCIGLISVTIPNSVTSIGKDALRGCSGLTSIIVESGNTTYDSRNNCNAIIETATNTLVLGCQSTIIPNSVTSIGGSAFRGCRGLTSVTIPNTVTNIEEEAFACCYGLTSVVWHVKKCADFVKHYEWDKSGPFYASPITSFTFGSEVEHIPACLCCGMANLTSVTIPNSVTSIGGEAFKGCRGLTSVTIPNSVTSIGGEAFYECSSLTSVTIPNSVTSIGGEAFKGCRGLTSVVWNAKNCADFSSGNYAPFYDYYYVPFYNSYIKSQITSFTFGGEVEHIPAYLCYGMENLTSLTIPNSVTSIGEHAFWDCSGLTSVTIGNSVTSIGKDALRGCSGLISIIVESGNTTYDSRNNCNAIIETATNTLVLGCQSTIIPNSVTSIGVYAFYKCSGLTSVTIPNSVTSIGDYAFAGCSGLTSVVWNAKNCADFAEYYDEYDNKHHYGPFYKIVSQITSFTFGSEVEHIPAYLCYDMEKLTSVTIPNSVTSIGKEAFHGCSGLTAVMIPNSVTSIGDYAFAYCSGLTSVTIPNSVTSIGYDTFLGCSGLTSITIPNSVTSIGDNAFKYCSGLTSVVWHAKNCAYFSYSDYAPYNIASQITSFTFGSEVEHIPAYLCYDMEKLTSVTIPNSVTSIGKEAFHGCRSLTSVTIPNSVTSIGDYAFVGCSGLTSITIPNSVTSIGVWAFKGCSGLTSVTIPNSVTSIGDGAFRGCSGLTSVMIGNSVTSIGVRAFDECDALQTIFVPLGQKARFAAMGLPAAKIVERNNEKLQQLLTLAQVYEVGEIETKDMAKAVRYYEGAIEEGSAEAAYHLGELYRNGKEVPANLQLAVDYFGKAADKHYKDAAQQLAACREALERYNRQMEQLMQASNPQVEPYYLFFDTETNGLPSNYQAPISATDNWPRLIQIGWIVTDADGNELQAADHLVYPDGFTIPSDVERLTGISYSRARADGEDLKQVLTAFMQQFDAVKHVVGHNIDFDLHIVGSELYRKGLSTTTILSKPSICTMRSTIDFCKLPPFTYGSWKFPKLQELYKKLFGTQFDQAHNAMNDIRATKQCFFELKKRGII